MRTIEDNWILSQDVGDGRSLDGEIYWYNWTWCIILGLQRVKYHQIQQIGDKVGIRCLEFVI